MSADLRIGTLTVQRSRHDGSPDPDGTVRALRLSEADDRRVLVVRSLSVPEADPAQARERLAALRRGAARPVLGPVDPRAEAVEFADEAEALRCLSGDVLRGDDRLHWWWSSRLPRHAPTAADTLVQIWTRQARWVPDVLTSWTASEPRLVVEALRVLGPERCRLVLEHVLLDYLPDEPRPGPPRRRGGAATGLALDPVVEVEERVVAVLAPVLADLPGGEVLALAATAVLLGIEPALVPTPGFARWLSLERARPRHNPRPVATKPPLAVVPSPEPSEPRPADVLPFPQREQQRPAEKAWSWAQQPWTGGGPTVRSDLASLLFAINLVDWFGLYRLGVGGTGWSVVEAVGRWLLRDVPSGRRRELLDDPLLPLLAQLDGRDANEPTPIRLGAATRPVRRFLEESQVGVETFLHPGSLVVSRTHLDVVFALHQIDMPARNSGLDQDPGWCPDLGRVVLFHYEGAG